MQIDDKTIRELSLDRVIASTGAVYLWLLSRANRIGVCLDSATFVADRLGLTRSMVSRAERRLIKLGLVAHIGGARTNGVRINEGPIIGSDRTNSERAGRVDPS